MEASPAKPSGNGGSCVLFRLLLHHWRVLREVGHTGLRKRALDGAKEGNVNPIHRPVSGPFGTGADPQVRACAGCFQRAAV